MSRYNVTNLLGICDAHKANKKFNKQVYSFKLTFVGDPNSNNVTYFISHGQGVSGMGEGVESVNMWYTHTNIFCCNILHRLK